MIIFNIPGILMLAISFGIAFGAGHLLGITAEGPLMILAGPLAIACDLAYRLGRTTGHWFYPDQGGSLFYLPVWLFGIVWLILGVVYTFNGRV